MTAKARYQWSGLFRLWGRSIGIILGVLAVIVALLACLWCYHTWKMTRNRARWKDAALVSLAGLSVTNDELRGELEELKGEPSRNVGLTWAHEHILLMTNGEYMIFKFWHGYNSGSVDHLFLARCSDGRWLYSTYHFCNSMAGVSGDEPPGSISAFAKTYFAREFDGKSDECLKRTWPTHE
jgi:hypothetical protein